MSKQTKPISVPRGHNVGKAIMASFKDYNTILIHSTQSVRNTTNKTIDVTITYSINFFKPKKIQPKYIQL